MIDDWYEVMGIMPIAVYDGTDAGTLYWPTRIA
jgi:hypothetical protein